MQSRKGENKLSAKLFVDEQSRYGTCENQTVEMGEGSVLSFRATLGVARLVSQCETISASRLSSSSLPLCGNAV